MAAKRRDGNVIPEWAKSLAGSLFGVIQANVSTAVDSKAPRKMLDQLGTWVGHLSQNAAFEWVPNIVRNESCAYCTDIAMARCCVCETPCCLGHGHVSFRAELVCDGCVGRLIGDAGGQAREVQATPESEAFKYFNLVPSATFEEVNAVYRERAKSSHPEQGGSPQDMAIAGKHLLTLKRYFERKAA